MSWTLVSSKAVVDVVYKRHLIGQLFRAVPVPYQYPIPSPYPPGAVHLFCLSLQACMILGLLCNDCRLGQICLDLQYPSMKVYVRRSSNDRSTVRAFAFCSKRNSARAETERNKAKNGMERKRCIKRFIYEKSATCWTEKLGRGQG